MTDYMTEQEQIQQLKNWVKQYGLTILLGLLVAMGMGIGWNAWNKHIETKTLQAAALYDTLLFQKTQNKEEEALITARTLTQQYVKTPYADMANFLIAQHALLAKDTKMAIHSLDTVIHESRTTSIRQIARLRKARILIADNQPDAALSLLKKIEGPAFIGLIDEANGDAYLALHKTADAKAAYQRALKELPQADITRPVLGMKLATLP